MHSTPTFPRANLAQTSYLYFISTIIISSNMMPCALCGRRLMLDNSRARILATDLSVLKVNFMNNLKEMYHEYNELLH
jgi:hypothetical protein